MAFPNDSSRIARGIGNLETSCNDYSNSAAVAARSLIRKTYHVNTLGVLANGDGKPVANAGPYLFFKNPVRIMGCNIIANVASSANILSYQTFSLKVLTAAGVAGNTIANITTQTVASGGTGNIIVGVPFQLGFSAISLANSYNRLPANSVVGLDIAPTSSGVVLGACTWAIDVEEEGPDGYRV